MVNTKDSHISQSSISGKTSGIRTLEIMSDRKLSQTSLSKYYLLTDIQRGGSNLAGSGFKEYCQDTVAFVFLFFVFFHLILTTSFIL